MSALADVVDWAMDRTVVPGYTKIGYALRGLRDASPDPGGHLADANVVVTGANSGLGLAATKQLAACGARVQMLVRDAERGERALEEVKRETGAEGLELRICDLADLSEVAEAAERMVVELSSVDAIIHNAGALTAERERSADGHELTFAVHVLGPLLLTERLLPLLEAGAPSRVIFVTSGGMYASRLHLDDLELEHRDFDGSTFYAHAKRIQTILTGVLDERLPSGVSVHAMHPGWAKTPGIERSLPTFNKVLGPLLREPAAGADTAVWLTAADEPLRHSGRLWMDRRPRPTHRLRSTEEEPGEPAELYRRLAEMLEEHRAGG